jgi:RNAse (barnase) inhibitor barstar
VENIFVGAFQTFLTITFKDFSQESITSYKQKIEIMNVLRRASDEQLSSIFDYFNSKGFFESNQSQ